MRVTIDDPELIADLMRYLGERADAIVEQVGVREVEVGILGSLAQDALRNELDRRVREWQETQRESGVDVRVAIDANSD